MGKLEDLAADIRAARARYERAKKAAAQARQEAAIAKEEVAKLRVEFDAIVGDVRGRRARKA